MNDPRFEVRDAGKKGRGIFAAAPLPAGTRIATNRGKPRWIWEIPEEYWPYTFQVDYDRYVLPRKGGAGWFINHSCEPNCLLSGNSVITSRDIKTGEELTFDYSTNVDWPGFAMACSCGSSRCRKVVRAYRFLPIKLKQKYGRNVADFILREYEVS